MDCKTDEEVIRELLELLKKNTMKEQANDVFEICSYVDLFLKLLISSLLPLFIVEHCHYSLKWQLER